MDATCTTTRILHQFRRMLDVCAGRLYRAGAQASASAGASGGVQHVPWPPSACPHAWQCISSASSQSASRAADSRRGSTARAKVARERLSGPHTGFAQGSRVVCALVGADAAFVKVVVQIGMQLVTDMYSTMQQSIRGVTVTVSI